MSRIRKRSSIRGFTFVEVFIVLSVFSLLSLAVYATFASGMRMWNRVNETTLSQRKALLFFERFAQEARQILNYPKIGLTAKNSEVSFPALIRDEIIKVDYLLQQDKLIRRQETLAGVLDEKETSLKSRIVLDDIEELVFNFAYQEEGKEDYSWKESWEKKDGIPLIIKVRIKSKDSQPMEKSVVIPLG